MPTRQEQQAELEHVLDNVLELPQGHPVRDALQHERIVSMEQLLMLSHEEMAAMQYQRRTNNNRVEMKTVSMGDVALLKPLCDMQYYKESSGEPLNDWTSVTRDEFQDFRRRWVWLRSTPRQPGVAPTIATNQLANFEKGIKRDLSAFPTLTDIKRWDGYERSLMIQAHAQGVSDVMDPTFQPIGADAIALFKRQCDFMMGVFDAKLKTIEREECMGKEII